ncbi:MAG: hypothetical protein N2440_01585 [Actinobacteria bacterium]|nr:hypothetical protein [Actinomycetota bacterium]
MKGWQRIVIYIAALAAISILISAFGYFILPRIIENNISEMIQRESGFLAFVELDVPYNFIFSGRIQRAKIYLPVIQVNDLNVRQFEVVSENFQIPIFKVLSNDYSFLKDSKKFQAKGSFVITPKDLNDYLRNQNLDYKVEVKDNNLYLTTYVSGIGKIKVSGRLEGNSSGANFVAERLIEPRLLSLIFYPQLWINISFNISFNPADKLFNFEKFFIDKRNIKVFFELKRGFYDEIFSELNQ